MKTAGEEDPNSHVRLHTEPSPWDGKSEPSSLIHTGWKVRKYPAAGEVFFLTFPFIELIGTWAQSTRGKASRTMHAAEDKLGATTTCSSLVYPARFAKRASGGNKSSRVRSSSFPQPCGRCAREEFLLRPGVDRIPLKASFFLQGSRFVVSRSGHPLFHLTIIKRGRTTKRTQRTKQKCGNLTHFAVGREELAQERSRYGYDSSGSGHIE